MKNPLFGRLAAVLLGVSLALTASLQAGEFRFDLGITYAQGINDAANGLRDLYTQAGYTFDRRVVVPVGLSLSPWYEFDNGVGVGADLGPIAGIAIENKSAGGGFRSDHTDYSYIIPVGAYLRYTLLRNQVVSPYARVGVRYPVVGGSNLNGSQPGPFGAVGVEFFRKKRVGVGAEIGYDASQITVKGPTGATRDVTFAGFVAGIFITF